MLEKLLNKRGEKRLMKKVSRFFLGELSQLIFVT